MKNSKSEKTFTDPFYTYNIFHKSKNFDEWYKNNTITFKNYRKNWTEWPNKSHVDKFPLHLNIEITTICNLACTFCYHRELKPEEKKHMSFELFKKIIDEAKLFKLPAVNLNGLGESMTHPRLIDMIKYCKESGIEDIMFHTNGTVMTEKQAKGLVESGLTQIIFSLDTTDKKIFEEMRVGANFEEVNANVERFINIRNGLKSKLPIVRVTMVLTENTIGQAEDFKNKWKDKADHVTGQDLVYSFDSEGNKDQTSGWKSKEKSYYKINKQQIIEEQKKNKKFFRCAYLYQSIKIHPDGNIDPCTPRNAPTVGNVSEGLSNVWHGEKIKYMRKMHDMGKWYEVDSCKKCDHPYIAIFKKYNKAIDI
jgi:radical SAM protein with 4Fe4S-binding SPASM domain